MRYTDFREIDWFRDYYGNLKPAMYISYEREAYYSLENPDLRITFDRNIMYRSYNLSLAAGVEGESILEPGQHLMELKAGGAIPVWLTKYLMSWGYTLRHFKVRKGVLKSGRLRYTQTRDALKNGRNGD